MYWYIKAFRNYLNFTGRARRKEFWMFTLVNFILAGVMLALDKMLGLRAVGEYGLLSLIYGLLALLPAWAVQFRRLHDTDRTALWLLLLLVPVIGWIVILIFNCQSGTHGENRFGPDSKHHL
ncbi:Inner membrane protein YhaH [Cronobacter condimenti 1330]|uniref:Inner membrane protein YhaH n=1 Tax=Cronobacter condimenti 1330 TaxID=1073999 RepID=K7ZY56_9ENTR|nr:DUF805 domain-containing protein [Cronobacter condimenti]ALB61432.1 hypothetical protein AFK62_02450 [Cronobacter condimenti 1330]CCJ71428.1 Inner membrane protein YhaH [Cronobacter condimenti 1330]